MAGLCLASGLLVGLVGYRLFHATLGLYGFVLGFLFGLSVASGLPHGFMGIAVAVVAGGIGALLASWLERAAFFLGGAFVGWTAGVALAATLDWWTWPVAIVAAALGGMAGIAAERLAVTAATAFAGAWLAIHGAAALATRSPVELAALPAIGTPAVAAAVVAGTAVLFLLAQRRRETSA
jgi:hypothetical protein